jgi:hypothetical protein
MSTNRPKEKALRVGTLVCNIASLAIQTHVAQLHRSHPLLRASALATKSTGGSATNIPCSTPNSSHHNYPKMSEVSSSCKRAKKQSLVESRARATEHIEKAKTIVKSKK